MRSQATGPVGAILALMGLFVLTACPPPPVETPDAGKKPDASVPIEGCDVDFSFRPASTATSVFVVGEWNSFDRSAHPLTSDASGTWAAKVRVPMGTWGYYFIADGDESIDPNNPDKDTCGSHQCSLLAACLVPGTFAKKVTIPGVAAGTTITVEGSIREPDGLAWPETTWRPLTAQELVVDKTSVTLKLPGLANGKYTVRLKPSQGEEVLLPFWIEDKPYDWRGQTMYMLMTDRFRDGDPTNNAPAVANVSESAQFRGGDLQGVQKAIEEGYFDQMGIKSIWITPWQTQPTKSYVADDGVHQVTGYHGYWPVKARAVDPRYGGEAGLANMVKAAHKKGIRIVMDAVLNHVSIEHEYYTDPAKAGWFRTGCNCNTNKDDPCNWDATPGRYYCLFNGAMPDINWTVPEAKKQFVSDILWWMDTFDIDGLRIDAAKHIEPEGIQALATAVRGRYETAGSKVFMFGESYTGNLGFLKEYIGPDKLDGQLNFPIYFAVPETIFGRDDKGLQAAKGTIEWSATEFPDTMVTFIGSHDDPRFMSKADPATRDQRFNKWDNLPAMPTEQRTYDRIYLALASLVTTPGVPLLYYGDEYGEWGGADPDNRHLHRAESTLTEQQKANLAKVRKLMTVRSQIRGLGKGTFQTLWCNNDAWGASDAGGGNLWAYLRLDAADPKESAVVVVSLKYESWPGVGVTFPANLNWPASGTVVDALSDREYSYTGSSVSVDVPGRGAVILKLK
ncbi:MAG: alpha-amylase family glycosyl hydrolase [Myxococcales bacterium]